jgi:glutamate formiminotransferase
VERENLFESVPNFSEGRRKDAIEAIALAASKAHLLDTNPDRDHNRTVISIAGFRGRLLEGLQAAVGEAVAHIDIRRHEGVHPRVGAADVVPIVPLGTTTLETCREVARELAERIWTELRVPVFFYGYGENRSLADIRAGRAKPDVGGPDLHQTAGAVCLGARPLLVAFNVMLFDTDVVTARALARALRESAGGVRGVQALIFELPGNRVQLSMNLFRLEETTPSQVLNQLERLGASMGAEQLVGLCPAVAVNGAAAGRLLEARMAAAAAREGAVRCEQRGGEEHLALGHRLQREAADLAGLGIDQDALLAGAERAAALIGVLRAAQVLDGELEAMLIAASRGLRGAVTAATSALYAARVAALDARIAAV